VISDNPLISIVTPFKNTSAFLNEMIDSVIGQTYQNWELILIDDHSTDDSFQIVKNYTINDSRIRVFRNPRSGIISGLREAYSHTKGVYITRMDSDDIMVSNKLEKMLGHLLQFGTGHIAIGLVKYFSDRGIGDGYRNYESWLNGLTLKGENYSELYKECVIPSPCWMLHRDDFESCGGFDLDIYPEDYDLVFRLYKNQIKCVPCDEVLHYWRDYAYRASRTHPNYSDNTFMDLKLKYFLELHYNTEKPLVVWGAGAKGKRIAKLLNEKNIDFNWVCDNPKKIGKEIYGHYLASFDLIDSLDNAQNIISVANSKAQVEIKKYFTLKNKKSMEDYFFFC
jgi:glycosyltransferase involved in cell wall biosynthesis